MAPKASVTAGSYQNMDAPSVGRESMSSLDSNDSPHMDVWSSPKTSRSFVQKHSGPPTVTTRATDSDNQSFTIKSLYRGSFNGRRDSGRLSVSGREGPEPIMLDEVSQILLEDIHQDTTKQVLKALGRFADICSQSNELQVQACQMGAPAAIVTLMKKWSIQKNVQAACFRVLIALTVGEESIKVRKTLWMVGGMEQILDSMAQFPESRSVQFFGCNALLSLLPSGSEEQDEKIQKWMGRRFLREYKGVKTVISAMIQFEEDRGIQESGCSVLLKLATFMHAGQDRKMLLESGAVSAFSVALESHPNDEDIQHYTTLFMNFMSGDL